MASGSTRDLGMGKTVPGSTLPSNAASEPWLLPTGKWEACAQHAVCRHSVTVLEKDSQWLLGAAMCLSAQAMPLVGHQLPQRIGLTAATWTADALLDCQRMSSAQICCGFDVGMSQLWVFWHQAGLHST